MITMHARPTNCVPDRQTAIETDGRTP